jgi:hypothetical protein
MADHVLQAIVTRYHGPGNVRGARVSARCEAGRLTLPWDHALNAEDNHRAAAEALARKFGWLPEGGRLAGGGLGNAVYAWVLVFEPGEPEVVRQARMAAEGATLRALRGLRDAARGVLAAWNGGDLAGKVRALEAAVEVSEIG